VASFFDDLHQVVEGTTGVDTVAAPFLACMANDSMLLGLRWTRLLEAKISAELEAVMHTRVTSILYLDSVEHRDAATQPLVVAEDWALLKRTLRALE